MRLLTVLFHSHISTMYNFPTSFIYIYHYVLHAIDPMSCIFNDMINMGYDLFRSIGLLIANKAD